MFLELTIAIQESNLEEKLVLVPYKAMVLKLIGLDCKRLLVLSISLFFFKKNIAQRTMDEELLIFTNDFSKH